MTKLLITGGAGFIGSNFVTYMTQKYPQYSIINLDNLTYAGNLDNLKQVEHHSNYSFLKGDITDQGLIDTIFKNGVDYVVHLAAESHVDRSIKNPSIFVQANVQGTQVLLEASRNYGVRKFVQVSTDEVYGTLGSSGCFSEHSPIAPNSPYSASKASADLIARAYYETYQLPVTITRCSNNYGPYQFPEKLIPLLILHSLQNKALPLYGDGLYTRDWLHVVDHCRALDLVLHQGRSGEVYNIGANQERTNLVLVHAILKHLNKPESLIQYVQDRPGHDRRYAIDASKLRDELGWRPAYTLERGLQETIKWYVDNKRWWSRIATGEYRSGINISI